MFLRSIRISHKFHQKRWITNSFLYNLLNVNHNATNKLKNYYKACMQYHPDHKKGIINKFLEVN